jgi:hypothetical protein
LKGTNEMKLIDNQGTEFIVPGPLGIQPGKNTTALKIAGFELDSTDPTAIVDISGKWNNSSATPTALRINVDSTASGANSLLLDLQVNSSSKWKCDKAGNVVQSGSLGVGVLTAAIASFAAGAVSIDSEGNTSLAGGAVDIGTTEGEGFVNVHGTEGGSVTLWETGAMLAILANAVGYSYFDVSFDTGIGGPIANCHGPIAKSGATDASGQCFCIADGSDSRLEINGTKVVGEQEAAIADATGTSDVVDRVNDILAAMRTHGLIAT